MSPDYHKRSFYALLLCNFVLIMTFTFINIGQSLISLNPKMKESGLRLGTHVGLIQTFEIVTGLIFFPVWGLLAVKIDARYIMVVGFIIMSTALILFPNSKISIPRKFGDIWTSFLMMRILFSLGSSACSCMVGTFTCNISRHIEPSRLTSMAGLFSGLGGFFGAVALSNLPLFFGIFLKDEYTTIAAAFFSNALILLLTSLIILATLDKTENYHKETNTGKIKYDVLFEKKNFTCYLSSFSARINTSFLPIFLASILAKDTNSFDGIPKRYRLLSFVHHCAYLLSAPIWGWSVKKYKTDKAATAASLIGSVGYFVIFSTQCLNGILFKVILAFSAIGGMGIVISSSSKLTEIPKKCDVSLYSAVFSFMGALGMLFISQVGGLSIENFNFLGPFLIVGIVNLVMGISFAISLK